jgi:hypothetical protein
MKTLTCYEMKKIESGRLIGWLTVVAVVEVAAVAVGAKFRIAVEFVCWLERYLHRLVHSLCHLLVEFSCL